MTNETVAYHHGNLRAALLDEAAAMVAEGGAEGVTMRGLGQRLGVSRGAPYRHFENKTALLVAVARAGFARLNERIRSIDAGAPEFSVERLRRLGEEYVRFALENPAHYRLMYGREALSREELPELREAANALFEGVVNVIEVYQRSGAIKLQDPRTQAYVAWSAMHGLASLLIDGQIQATVDVEELIQHTTRTVLEGVRSEP